MRLKNNTKKVLLGSLAALACGSVAFGVSAINAVNASAADVPFYSDGAAVYITDSVEDAKVRFNATMTESFFGEYFTDGKPNAGVETGILVVPYDVYRDSGVEALNLTTYETCKAQRVETTYLWEENNGVMEAYAVLTGSDVPVDSHNRVLYYVCYVATLDGETVTNEVYTAARKTSMSYVAMKSQDDADLTDTQKADLKSTYMHEYTVKFNDAYARTETMTYGDKLTANTSNSLDNLYWDAAYTDPVKETDYVTCADEIFVKEQNTAELMSYDYLSDTTKDGTRQDNNAASALTIGWESSFEGEKGVMSMEYTHGVGQTWTPKFTVYPRQSVASDSAIYTQYKYLVIRMYIVKNDTYVSDWMYVTVNNRDSVGCKYTLSEYDYNKWIDIKFELSDIKASLEAGDTTYGKGLYFYGTYGKEDTVLGTEKGLFYVSDLYLEKGSDDVIQLTGANYTKYTKDYKAGTTFIWSQEYDALQVNNTGNKTYFGVTLQGLWNYETVKDSYDYFTCEIYWPQNGTTDYDDTVITTNSGHMRFQTPTDASIFTMRIANEATGKESATTQGEWYKVMLPIDGLQYTQLAVYQQSSSVSTRMYVRNIELKKSDIELNVANEDDLIVNETFTITATDRATGEEVVISNVYGTSATNGNTNSTKTPNKVGDWYLNVLTNDGRVGYKKITVKAATA